MLWGDRTVIFVSSRLVKIIFSNKNWPEFIPVLEICLQKISLSYLLCGKGMNPRSRLTLSTPDPHLEHQGVNSLGAPSCLQSGVISPLQWVQWLHFELPPHGYRYRWCVWWVNLSLLRAKFKLICRLWSISSLLNHWQHGFQCSKICWIWKEDSGCW